MDLFRGIEHAALQYYGIDWLIMLTVFTGVFLLGDRKRLGFVIGMVSAATGIVFSYQIGSLANGISSVVLLGLYFRGYLHWRQ